MKTKVLKLNNAIIWSTAIFQVVLLIAFFLFVLGIQNSKGQNTDKNESPYFWVKSEDPSLDQLPLKATNVNVTISGVIADVTVSQVYTNSGKKALEAIYVFPASTRSAVYAMRMKIGERILTAKIQEKEKARKTYETAKKEGKSASLLEQQRPNVFQMNVANIMPGDTIEVEMKYTELLIPEDNIYSFVYPTVVGPRYVNPNNNTASNNLANNSNSYASNPYLHEGELPTNTVDINTVINAGMPIQEVSCTSHKTTINFSGKDIAACKLDNAEKLHGNKDYVLKYKLAGNQVQSGLILFRGQTENFFLAMLQPPARPKTSDVTKREYVFIMDVSGSMDGFPINVSKKLLSDLVSNLKPSDLFNIVLFAASDYVMEPKSIPATPENLKKALELIDKQSGSGGTELLPALNKALKLPVPENYARTFVISTDGYVTVEREAFDLIKNNLSTANFFAFGIGSSVNRFIIEGMARTGKGEAFIVENENVAKEKAEKFREYVSQPVLTHVKANFNGFEAYDIEPVSIPDVIAQRPVIIFGKWKGEAKGTIQLTGFSGGGNYKQNLVVSNFSKNMNNPALPYLWARERLQQISDYKALSYREEDKKAITELALKYNLLSEYTSFVAVDSLIRNKTGENTTVNQALPLPENVSDNAVGNNIGTGNAKGNVGYAIPKVLESADDETGGLSDVEDLQSQAGGEDLGDVTPEIVISKKEEIQEAPKEEVFMFVEEMPEFPGGDAEIRKFIAQNLVYPQTARENSIQGKVFVQFEVLEDGTIDNIKVVRGVDPLLDAEAIRVVKEMAKLAKFKPGKQRGKPVKVKYVIPVNFTLKN